MQASAHILSKNQLPDIPFTPGLNRDKGRPAESRATLAKMHPDRLGVTGDVDSAGSLQGKYGHGIR